LYHTEEQEIKRLVLIVTRESKEGIFSSHSASVVKRFHQK